MLYIDAQNGFNVLSRILSDNLKLSIATRQILSAFPR